MKLQRHFFTACLVLLTYFSTSVVWLPYALADATCDKFCGALIGHAPSAGSKVDSSSSHLDGVLRNTSGGTGWSSADDLYCASHGLQTNPYVSPDPTSSSTPQTTNDGSCAYPLASGENCSEATWNMNMCRWHGGQVEEQCLAYYADTDAGMWDWIILLLDVAATGTCAWACFSPGNVSTIACAAGSLAAGGGEILASMKMKNSSVSMILAGLGTTAGVVELGANLGVMSTGAAAKTATSEVSQAGSPGALDHATEVANNANNASKTTQQVQKWAACASAALFAIMTALRLINIMNHQKDKSKACDGVKSLASSATAATGSAYGYGGTTSGVGGSGSSTASSGTTGVNGSSTPTVPQQCLDQGISCLPAQQSAATDGQILGNSGLDRIAAQNAPKLDLSGLQRAVDSGNAGAAVGAALGGVPADFANGLTQLAKAAQENAQQLAEGVASSVMRGGGGSGSGGGSGDNGLAALGSLFGNKDGGGGSRAPANLLAYGKPGDGDIWHSKSHQTIFEIVSDRITKSSNRLK